MSKGDRTSGLEGLHKTMGHDRTGVHRLENCRPSPSPQKSTNWQKRPQIRQGRRGRLLPTYWPVRPQKLATLTKRTYLPAYCLKGMYSSPLRVRAP